MDYVIKAYSEIFDIHLVSIIRILRYKFDNLSTN